MLILALESSAKAASVALVRDGELVAQYSQCCGLTHSRTLLPMLEDMMKNSGIDLNEPDLIAVAQGPGSFPTISTPAFAASAMLRSTDIDTARTSLSIYSAR